MTTDQHTTSENDLPLLIDRITGNIKLITFIRNEAERLITAHTEELTASLEALEDGEPVNEPCDPMHICVQKNSQNLPRMHTIPKPT